MGVFKNLWKNVFSPRERPNVQPKFDHSGDPSKERSSIEKMRDKVAEFDEDYKDIGERILGAFVTDGWVSGTIRASHLDW